MKTTSDGFTWSKFFKILSELPREERVSYIRTQFNVENGLGRIWNA